MRVQSFEDFEVIICDDGSTDASVETASVVAREDARFKVFTHDNNIGMTQNWNRALQYASGDYVMKLDADDAFAPQTLSELLSAVDTQSVIAAFCRTVECNERLEAQKPYRGEDAFTHAGLNASESQTLAAEDWFQMAFNDRQIWHSNAFLLKTERLKSMGGWDEDFGCASDTDLILRILEQDGDIAHVPYQGVMYRMREGSISDSFRKNDALVDENYIAALRSLQRAFLSGRKLGYKTRLNWYRLWQNAKQRSVAVRPLPDDTLAIPMTVKLLGAVQRLLYQVKRRLTG